MDRHAAVLARDGDHGLTLDVELLLVSDAVRPFDDEVGFGHGRVDVATAHGVVRELAGRLLRVEDRIQSLGSERHVALRRPQRVAVSGGEEADGLRLMLDLAADRHKDRLVVRDQRDDVGAGNVRRGDHGDLAPVEVRVQVDPQQACVRLGGADSGAEPRAGKDEVVRVFGEPRELLRTLSPQRKGGPRSSRRGRSRRNDHRRLNHRHRRGYRRWGNSRRHPCLTPPLWTIALPRIRPG